MPVALLGGASAFHC